MSEELTELRRALDGLRASVFRKLAGLSEADARRSTVPSGTNLAGLVQHLTYVESHWFEEIVSGGSARGQRSMLVDDSTSLRALRADYRAACAASNAVIDRVADPDARFPGSDRNGNLRTALIAVIEETARHAGHADIIREQIDGRTGR